MKTFNTRLTAILLSTIGLLTGVYGQLTPSQDAYTFSQSGGQNYGAATKMVVESNPQVPVSANAYVQFDLSSIPSNYTGANVTKASLKLFVSSMVHQGSFNVNLVNGSWTELGIAYNNAPSLGTALASDISLTSANVHNYITVDVTSGVQAWLNGSEPNDGIALVAVGNSDLDVSFDSKENTSTSHPPELDIVFAGGSGNGISGITTANGSGLSGGGTSGNLNLGLINSCNIGQVLAWNGAGGGWVCSTVTGGGGISGSGTVNSLPLFNGATSVGSSNVFQSTTNTNIGIGTTTPGAALDVNGNINLPNTAPSGAGVISMGGTPFLSNYGPSDPAGRSNTFVGGWAGNMTMTGGANSVFGNSAFALNTTGYNNTALGVEALPGNTTGSGNTVVGAVAFFANHTGSNNTVLGSGAGDTSLTGLNYTTAIGAFADVTQANSLVLGSIANVNGCDPSGTPPCQSTKVGIGTTAPAATLDVEAPTGATASVNFFGTSSTPGTFAVNGATSITGSLSVNGVQVTGGGGGGGITSVTGTNGVNATTSGGSVTLSANQGLVAFQTDLTAGITTAETTAENYASANFLPLTAASSFATLGANAFTGNQTITGSLFASGNVGIGTITPQATLDVNGSINLPSTTSSTIGVLSVGGAPFLSNYPGTSGSANTFVGLNAGNSNSTNIGGDNSAFGNSALLANTSGNQNSAFGNTALFANTSGSFNSAFGVNSLSRNAQGSNNSAFGTAALVNLNGGNQNIAVGWEAGISLRAAESNNIYIGNPGVTGESNIIRIGDPTVQSATYIAGSLNFPDGTKQTTAYTGGGGGGGSGTVTSVAAGAGLLASPSPITTSGTLSLNTAVVPQLGTANNFVGNQSVTGNISATGEISTNGLIFAGSMSTFGTMNAGSYGLGGTSVLAHAPSTGGSLLLGENTGNSTLLSPLDLSSTTAIGDNTLRFYTGGNYNTALGNSALYEATSGANNTGAGYGALFHNTSGSNNTAMGYFAGNPTAFQNTTGSDNTFLGANSGVGNQTALNYATAIGANAVVGQPNSLVLGSIANLNGCSPTATPACLSTSVGIGTATPNATLDVEAPSGTTPTVVFGSASNQAAFTVNGSLNVTGAVTCGSGCGGGGGGGITSVTGTNGVNAVTSGGAVTLSLNPAYANTFTSTQTINTSTGNGVSATSSSSSSSGLSGSNTSTSGLANGVAGSTNSPLGSGVVGVNQSTATLGGGYGVYGLAGSPANVGVGGVNNTTAAGSAYGVFGQSFGSTGAGVFGTGIGSGVTGSTSSPTGSGVVATNFATSGNAYGLYAQSSSSPSGTGVYGTGSAAGVYGVAASSTGTGVVGVSNAGWAGFFQGSVDITNNLSVVNNAQVLGNLSVTGDTTLTGTVTGTLAVGGDAPISHNPRMWFSGFLPGNLGNSPFGGVFTPDQAVYVTRITFATNSPTQNCTTPSQVALHAVTSYSPLYSLSMNYGHFGDSGPIIPPIPIPASSGALSGGILIVGVPASGCDPVAGQSASDVNVSVQYVMQ